jgi:protein ImuB
MADVLYACLYRPPQPDGGGAAALHAIACEFSPRFEAYGDDLVVVDVSGLDRLIGPPRVIGEELRRTAAAHGLRVHVAVAGTQTAARVLAQAQPGLTVVARGGEAEALAPIVIGILEKFETQRTQRTQRHVDQNFFATSATFAFSRWGVRTLGELAALPAADLTSRIGRSASAWQAIARGDDLRPLVPTLEEERFESTLDLEWPIEGLEPLSFVLTRLLEPLSTRLERRDRGAAVLHVLLWLVRSDGDPSPVYARRLELPTPMRDVRALRTLALLDLESHPPDAAIERVTIVIDPTPGRVLQHTLFTRAHPTPEQIATLLARLGALMGQDRIGAAACVDTYRPGAFDMQPFATVHDSKSEIRRQKSASFDQTSDVKLQTSLRRCRHSVPARVAVADGRPVRVTTDRRGYPGGAVVHSAGPWRVSGDWWLGAGGSDGSGGSGETNPTHPTHQASWDRDEWDVALSDGAVYRVFRDRQTDGWFIDAIVD